VISFFTISLIKYILGRNIMQLPVTGIFDLFRVILLKISKEGVY